MNEPPIVIPIRPTVIPAFEGIHSGGLLAAAQEKPVNKYTAIIKQEGDWWIGWIQEIPGVNCQEPTRDELLETLRITLTEILVLNREDTIVLS